MTQILRHILHVFWRDSCANIILICLMIFISALTSVAAPYLFSRAIDELASAPNQFASLKTLLIYAFLFGCAKAFGQAARFLIFLCAERLTLISNTSFFTRLLRKTPAFFLEHNAAKIGTARQQGTQTLTTVTQFVLGGILPAIVQIVFGVILLSQFVSWDIATIVLVYGAAVVGLDYVRIGYVRPYLDAAFERSQANASLIGNAVAVIETLRQTRGEEWIAKRFALSAQETFANWRSYVVVSSAFSGVIGIAAAVQLAATFLLLVPRYEAGLISIGSIVFFNTLLIQLNEPFHMIGKAIKETVEAAAGFRPLATMWTASEEQDPPNPEVYQPSQGILVFEDVAFRYPNKRGIQGISFTIQRGIPTFITGETGAGKSTILRLLLKGLQPTEGRILADGIDLANITAQNWFAHVGVVPQEVVLLNDTISTNIVLGRRFDAHRLRAAAQQASILSRISAMPEGFDTVVGERGLKLSGGERQRIAIARALYGDPMFLILDEASSALDDDTERQIMDSLRSISNKLTIIAVTHRTSSVRAGDQIICLPVLP